jgi:hypothetical protein
VRAVSAQYNMVSADGRVSSHISTVGGAKKRRKEGERERERERSYNSL